MKNLLILALVLGFELATLAQTKKPTTPAKKPASTATRPVTTTTKPATTKPAPAPVQSAPAAKPAAASTEPTAEELQKRQELYDKYNGNAPKTATPAPNSKAKTEKPDKTTNQPKPRQEMSRATEYDRPSSSSDESKFKVGFRGGVNLTNIGKAGDFVTDGVESLPTFHAGVVFNIGGKLFSVQPEILFSQLGINAKAASGSLTASVEAVVNTVQVPVLLKLSFGGDKFRFFINGGGYGSYELGGTQKITINGSTTTQKIEYGADETPIEYGAVGGAGIQLGLGRAKLLLEGRYNYGLGSNAKKVAGTTESYSRVIMGSVGLLIPIGGR